MNAKRKAAAAPDMGGLTDDWGKLAAIRKSAHSQEETQAPPPTPKATQPAKAAAAPARAAKPEPAASGTSMTRRSWYASADAADELARVVDDIHHATRAPKHEVVSELFRAAVAAAPRVQKKLSRGV